jgi:hypothetical protein
MLKVDVSQQIVVPLDVAACPACGAAVILDPTEWGEDDGGPVLYDFALDCSMEPNPETPEWNAWVEGHVRYDRMPYVYWLPLEAKVKDWLKTVELVDSAADRRKLRRWNEVVGAV